MFEGSSFQDVMDKFLFMERQTLSRGGRKKEKGNRPTVEKSGGPKNSRGIFFGFNNIYIFRFPQGKEKKRKKGHIIDTEKVAFHRRARARAWTAHGYYPEEKESTLWSFLALRLRL